jgi:hypothetical protein
MQARVLLKSGGYYWNRAALGCHLAWAFCFHNALALVLYLTPKRSLQMVANHRASNDVKELCINNNRVEIYFHNATFHCQIWMWHICKSYWSWHYHKPHQVFHTQKCAKKYKTKQFKNFWETWNTLLLYTFAQNLAPSNFLKVVGYMMNLQIAYYHFRSAISHIWHQQEPYNSELWHCWSSIAYVLQGFIAKQSVHLLKKVGCSKIQICSSGFCTWPAFLGRIMCRKIWPYLA